MMRYLTLFIVVLALWVLVERLVLRDRQNGDPGTIRRRLQDFGQYVHWVFGVVAAVLLGLLVVRLIVVSLRWQ